MRHRAGRLLAPRFRRWPLTPGDTAILADAFDESDLPLRVDIVDLVTCSPAFRREMERHAALLFDKA